MDARKETGPLSGIWTGIKGRHKALNNGALFKPDIAPILKSYDQGLTSYDKFREEKKKLSGLLDELGKALNANNDQRNKHVAEREKIDAKDEELRIKYVGELKKYVGDENANVADVSAAITGYVNAVDDGLTMHKALTDRVASINLEMCARMKKVRDDYKSRSEAVTSGIKKLEADADKFEAQIRQIVTTYQKTAVEMDHDEIVASVRSLVDGL